MDYETFSTTLMFAACETQHCVNVATIDDRIVELNEMFVITLERTPDLDSRIMLNPVAGHVEIIDDDCKFLYTLIHLNKNFCFRFSLVCGENAAFGIQFLLFQ